MAESDVALEKQVRVNPGVKDPTFVQLWPHATGYSLPQRLALIFLGLNFFFNF